MLVQCLFNCHQPCHIPIVCGMYLVFTTRMEVAAVSVVHNEMLIQSLGMQSSRIAVSVKEIRMKQYVAAIVW